MVAVPAEANHRRPVNRSVMKGLLLAEAVQIDGGIVFLFVVIMVALLVGFIGLCWAAYKAGAGNRIAQVVVGLASVSLVVSMILGGGFGSLIPLAILASCAATGRVRSRR